MGTISVGKRADLILVDANPLEDITNVQKRSGVMLRGKWFSEAELRKMLAKLAALYCTGIGKGIAIHRTGPEHSDPARQKHSTREWRSLSDAKAGNFH